FDDVDDGNEYPEFRIAAGKWNSNLYQTRLKNTADAILSLSPDMKNGPDIICLEEIESIKVLRDLADGPLKNQGYRWFAAGGPEDSAIHSGVLSRIPVTDMKSHAIADASGRTKKEKTAGDELILFVCHWKSRREGNEKTEPARRASAALVQSRIRAILAQKPSANIVVCGDFNESPDEFARNKGAYPTAFMPQEALENHPGDSGPDTAECIPVTDRRETASSEAVRPVLFSPWKGTGGFSYSYRGSQEQIDGFLLSSALLDSRDLEFLRFEPSRWDKLFNEKQEPSAWNGHTGYSDHVPILLVLSKQ
ncbi:MAG: endonuclease/exonuclease/phosphatase family protein, partial [Spirochaetia bacterium]|nr:endonuclease/exonuclease/phosphatase family protein [Spirochaetia bacterium]